jgi:alkyl hydroperoxide reductase subunit AhpC
LRQDHPRIVEAGSLVVVLPQKEDAVRSYLSKQPMPFPILPDGDRSRARGWGVYHPLGIDAFRTARPGSFIVGGEGKIRYTFIARSQFGRAPMDDLIRELQAADRA